MNLKTLRSFKEASNKIDVSNVDGQYNVQTSYRFLTGIVKDVISNPYEYLNRKIENDKSGNTLKDYISGNITELPNGATYTPDIQNFSLIDNMPMNSIIAYIVNNNQSKDGSLPVVVFPFFSSHLSLPVKPGEYVWILLEDHGKTKYYYWLSRKSGILQTEDLNFTNEEREVGLIDLENLIKASGDYLNLDPEEIKKVISIDKSPEGNFPDNLSMTDLLRSSHAFSSGEHTGEPVPRLSKDCSDILIQGSNNAGIHITKEKFSLDEKFEQTLMTSIKTNEELPSKRKPLSPAIDIYVQRKRSDIIETSVDSVLDTSVDEIKSERLSLIKNRSNLNHDYEYFEINKNADLLYGDDLIHLKEIKDDQEDAINIASRLYLTANSDFDLAFKTSFNVLEERSGPASILYGQNTRLAANLNARITSAIGESFIDLDEKGNVVIKASKGGAYISLRADGSIAIVPGDNGLLYLGGDELSTFNTALVQTAIPAIGTVTGIPIVSTMGGVVGIDPPGASGVTGKFASKVLIK